MFAVRNPARTGRGGSTHGRANLGTLQVRSDSSSRRGAHEADPAPRLPRHSRKGSPSRARQHLDVELRRRRGHGAEGPARRQPVRQVPVPEAQPLPARTHALRLRGAAAAQPRRSPAVPGSVPRPGLARAGALAARSLLGKEALPEARVVEYPHAGHWPHEELPAQVAHDLHAWLETTRGRHDGRGAPSASPGSSCPRPSPPRPAQSPGTPSGVGFCRSSIAWNSSAGTGLPK
jgi:hypothetical protein